MPKGNKRTFMGRPIPAPDRSKWTANLPTAKPYDPDHTKAYAKTIRDIPELWEIFVNLKPDDWPSEDVMGRLSHFAAKFEKDTALRPDRGQAYHLLRKLAEGHITSLE